MNGLLRVVPWVVLSGALAAYPIVVHAGDDRPVAITPDGGRYWGPLQDGRRQGQGLVKWDNGAVYEGGFADGLFSGKGRLRFANGDVYEGAFRKGIESGKGQLTTASGSIYIGQFRSGQLHGTGRLRYENGSVYEGQFKKGLPDGHGQLLGPTEKYLGDFRRGEISGRGEMHFQDGRKYVGDFVHGQFEGKGRLEYPSGQVYEGDFVAGGFTGQGLVTWPDGRRHEGRFHDWKPDGPGTYLDVDGNSYAGNFRDGGLVGKARLSGKDGSLYDGEVQGWLPHGLGEIRLANGDVYRGQFQYGVYDGEGTLTYATPRSDGRVQDTGTWRYGRLKAQEEEERRRSAANVERALYEQGPQLSELLKQLRPRDSQAINLYLLAIAGDGSQEVFRREVDFVRTQFDTRFGTQGHSLALINSRSTVGSASMATLTSIRRTVSALASEMDRERDILFVYITSHGSEEREITLGLPGMMLPPLTARELGAMLKESGVRWKVVIISACYAGGFMDELRDPNALVIAAARADRRLFGCADENDFTYFGRAFFKEALSDTSSFEDAFSKAAELVAAWEDRDARNEQSQDPAKRPKPDEHHSLPQMDSPPAIRDYLKLWRAQLPATDTSKTPEIGEITTGTRAVPGVQM